MHRSSPKFTEVQRITECECEKNYVDELLTARQCLNKVEVDRKLIKRGKIWEVDEYDKKASKLMFQEHGLTEAMFEKKENGNE